MKSIAATEAREHFADLIQEVSERKQKYIIERRGKPCAVVIPLEDLEPIQGRVDQILHEGRQRLKDFADASSDWFWEMDADCRFSYFSSRFTEITGVPQEALLGKTREETGVPDVIPEEWERHLADLAARRSFRNFQHPRTLPNGQVVHLSINGKAIFDEAGNFQGYRGSGSDVTEYTRTREALRESEEQLDLIARTSNVPMFITRVSDGAYLYINTAGAEIFGLTIEGMDGRSSRDFYYYPSDRKKLLAALQNKSSVQNLELRFKKADGTTVWVLDSVIALKYRGEDALLSTVIDITQHKQTEVALRENQEALAKAHDELELRVERRTEELRRSNDRLRMEKAKLREMLENSPIGVTINTRSRDDTRIAGVRLFVNSALVRMFGGTDHESIIETPVEESWVDLDQLAAIEKTFKDGGDLVDFEARRRRMDGTTWWVSMSTRPIEFDGHHCTMAWHFDITERKKVEEARQETERRFQAVVNNSPSSIALVDTEGRYLLVNRKWQEWFNPENQDVIGRTIHDFDPADHADRVTALDREIIETGVDATGEHVTPRADGTLMTAIWQRFPVLDDHGKIIALGTINTDITERKRMEETLRESEAHLDEALEAMSEGFVYFDADDRLVRANSKHRELFPSHADHMVPGTRFEDLLRMQVQNIRLPWAEGREEEWIAERLAQHRNQSNPVEQEFADGRIIRLSEYRTKSGGTVSIRTDITELKRIEQALRKSERRFRTITEALPVPVIITRRSDGEILYVNPKAGPALGLSADEIIGRSVLEFYADSTGREARLAALDEDGYVRDDEIEMRKADGSPISTIHSLQTIEYQGEEAVLGGFYDITERKRTEDKLRRNEALIRALIEHSPVAISIKDLDGRYTFVSPAYTRYLGMTADDAVGKNAADILSPESLAILNAGDRTMVKSGVALQRDEAFPVTVGSATLQVTKFPILDDDGNTISIGTIGIDVTEQKEAEKRLQESEKRLRQTTQLARIGYYEWDAVADRCLYCSDEHARIHGLTPDQYIARAAAVDGEYSLTHPDDRGAFERAMKELRGGKPIEIEYRTLTPDGKIYHVREIAEPVFDEAGRVVLEIGASQDVTALHLAEERSRQAQKMEAVGQLTGGIAHDFNNLLAVILGNAEIVVERVGGNDKSAQAIIRAADRGAELTQRLLAFSRRQPLQSKEIDLEQLAHGMGHLLRRTLGETIEVGISPAPGLWNAVADPGQVENALLNLAINARDAMPEGGKLIIGASNATLDESYVANHAELSPGDYVVLSVSDTGSGMTPEVLSHVFEPFYTTKGVGEGSGLGLSMVYGFAKQSGGDVTIRSEPGHGTTVKIYLPRGREAGEAGDPDKAAVPLGQGETVLVVEDDPDVRTLTESMLHSLGYRVLMAEDAAAGIEVLAAETGVELVLSDVVLTGGMSGPDLAERVRAIDPAIKVLFMSGYAEKIFRDQNPLPEGADLISKPFRKHELARRVQQALMREPALDRSADNS